MRPGLLLIILIVISFTFIKCKKEFKFEFPSYTYFDIIEETFPEGVKNIGVRVEISEKNEKEKLQLKLRIEEISTAIEGVDYIIKSPFENGLIVLDVLKDGLGANIYLDILADSIVEAEETIVFKLSNESDLEPRGEDTFVLKISEGSSRVIATIGGDVVIKEGSTGFVDIILSQRFEFGHTIFIKSVPDGLAKISQDFRLGDDFSGTIYPVKFNPLSIRASLKITAYDDIYVEGDENIKLLIETDDYFEEQAVDVILLDESQWFNKTVCKYPFEGQLLDYSGNGNTGEGTVEFINDRNNVARSALHLNGIDQSVEVSNSTSLNIRRQISAGFWWKHESQESNSTYYTIFEKSDNIDGHAAFGVWLLDDQIQFCIQPDNAPLSNQRCISSEVRFTEDQWYYVVSTFDGDSMKIYLNDMLVNSKGVPYSALLNIDAPLKIGSDKNNPEISFIKGGIDDLTIYNYSLGDQEIDSLFDN